MDFIGIKPTYLDGSSFYRFANHTLSFRRRGKMRPAKELWFLAVTALVSVSSGGHAQQYSRRSSLWIDALFDPS
jgi:hypothetical protein